MINDPTIKLFFGHLAAFKELVAEKESEDLERAVDEIIEAEIALEED